MTVFFVFFFRKTKTLNMLEYFSFYVIASVNPLGFAFTVALFP